MVDPFVILAPVLLLAVVALLRFVGCASLLGIDDVAYAPPPITVNNPKPTITGFDPPDATAQDPAFELTVNGSNFVTGLSVKFGNTDVSVIPPVTPTQIKVTVPATEVATPNTTPGVTVTVTNPAPGGGSASATFTIQELVKVTFPGPGPNDQPATGNSLNFDATVWSWEPGTLDDSLPHIFSHQSGSFTFVNGPRLLKSMIVSANNVGGVVKVDNNIDPVQQVTIPSRTAGTPGTPKRLEDLGSTKFTKKTVTVTISFEFPDSLVIDTIFYQGPR